MELEYADRATLLRIIAEQAAQIEAQAQQIVALQSQAAQIEAQAQQIVALQRQVETLVARVAELQHRDPPAFVKANRPQAPLPQPARKKRELNFARRREEPTQTIIHAEERCPDCDQPLVGGRIVSRRQVIDLPIAPVTITDHVVISRHCPQCDRDVTPTLDLSEEVLGQHRGGLRLMGVIAILREQLRLPIGLIVRYLQDLHQLQLSRGEVVAILQTISRRAEQAVTAIREAIRASPVVHMDETGWREDGHNGYLWSASTATLRYCEHGNRSKAMVDTVLGSAFDGVLVTDFYAAYDHYPGLHQRCWVHLLRDIHDLKRKHPTDVGLEAWATAVTTLYRQAKAAPEPDASRSAQAQEDWRHQQQQAFERALAQVCQPFLQQSVPQRVLCQRIADYLSELFTFVADPRVPADNNAAERSVRPVVTRRKISGGTRSPAGTACRTRLWTLTDTWNLQGKSPLAAWMALIRNPATAPV